MSLRFHNVSHQAHALCHKGHDAMHYVYLTAVSIEAHGWYGRAALGLLVFTVAAHLLGEPVE